MVVVGQCSGGSTSHSHPGVSHARRHPVRLHSTMCLEGNTGNRFDGQVQLLINRLKLSLDSACKRGFMCSPCDLDLQVQSFWNPALSDTIYYSSVLGWQVDQKKKCANTQAQWLVSGVQGVTVSPLPVPPMAGQ